MRVFHLLDTFIRHKYQVLIELYFMSSLFIYFRSILVLNILSKRTYLSKFVINIHYYTYI